MEYQLIQVSFDSMMPTLNYVSTDIVSLEQIVYVGLWVLTFGIGFVGGNK